jgi:hypothetical protein
VTDVFVRRGGKRHYRHARPRRRYLAAAILENQFRVTPLPGEKKTQAEMTTETAKFLLSCYRSSGADARDPFFKEALEQAERDPELASWFREQREFDEIFAAKLRLIEPPADLEAVILAGLRTTSAPRYAFVRWLPIAAALVLGLIVLGQMRLSAPAEKDRFMAFYSYATADFNPLPHLDHLTKSFAQVREFIKNKGAPLPSAVPIRVAGLPTAGCKTFIWEEQAASLICFTLPGGELLHLFAIDKKVFKGQSIPVGFQKLGNWNVEFSEANGTVMMWVSRAPLEVIKQFV